MSVRPVIEAEFQPQLSNVLIDSNLQRKDNRNSDQIRPIFIKPNLIPQANGSAYIELGDTKLVVSVFGPRQNKRMAFSPSGQLTCEFKFSTFACEQRRGHIRDNEEKDISQLILAALVPAIKLENYPKSLIDIYITVLENGGTQSCLAAGITASSVALATAGIEMLDLVAASSGGFFENNKFLLDCNREEERFQQGYLVIATMPSFKSSTHLVQVGDVDLNTSKQALETAVDSTYNIYSIMNLCLKQQL